MAMKLGKKVLQTNAKKSLQQIFVNPLFTREINSICNHHSIF